MLKGKKILVIEDSSTIKLQIKMIVEAAGAVFSEAGSEFGMLTKISEAGVIADVIIMNLILNYEDGINLINTLKTYEKYKNIPIIIITEKVDINTMLKAKKLGVKSCIKKPLSKAVLISRLNEALGEA
jgi:PleD family two-component response regulator